MSQGVRVFVTRELYPFTAGGIGRVVGNILATSTPQELANTAIVYVSGNIEPARLKAVYPQVRFVLANESSYRVWDESGRRYPPLASFSDHRLHGESMLAMQALLALEQDVGPLGYVEFPDWGGLAFETCQARRLGRGLRDATIAVRLHTTDSLLSAIERRWTDTGALALYDLERKALADCDLVVAQLAVIGRRVQQFYGFDDVDWLPRLHVHAPPVLVEGATLVEGERTVTLDTPITFTSKIQHVKRPEVFVKGCSEFFQRHPEVTAQAQFLAHAFDPEYLKRVKALIPRSMKARFVFLGLSGAARDKVIARSVCVFPSSWESFCLATYEASITGAVCVVNRANPAFSPGTPWRAGENCTGFDGTAASLAKALEEAYFGAPLRPVELPRDPAPWNCAAPSPMQTDPAQPPRVTVVVSHLDDSHGLALTLDSVAASHYANLAITVVDRGSTDPVALAQLARLESSASERLSLRRTPFRDVAAVAFNLALDSADGHYVMALTAGDEIDPGYLAEAVAALQAWPVYSGVTCHGRIIEPGSRYERHLDDVGDYWPVLGEAGASGLQANHFASPGCLMRLEFARRHRFRPDLDEDAVWEFHLRAIAAGARYLVAPTLDVTTAALPSEGVDAIRRHDLVRDKMLRFGDSTLPQYVLARANPTEASADQADIERLEQMLDEYRNSETVFATLTIARALDRRVPWLLRMMKWGMRTGWRVVKLARRRRD